MKEHPKQPKPKSFIDSSIYLEVVVEGKHQKDCLRFLDKVGYKNTNLGIVSVFIMGEIFAGVFKSFKKTETRLKALGLLESFLSEQIETEKVNVITLEKNDLQYIDKINDIDRKISYDDASNLSKAISVCCDSFITIDEVLLNEETRNRFRQEFRIKIKSPAEF